MVNKNKTDWHSAVIAQRLAILCLLLPQVSLSQTNIQQADKDSLYRTAVQELIDGKIDAAITSFNQLQDWVIPEGMLN